MLISPAVPAVRALSVRFRARFMARLNAALPDVVVAAAVWTKSWVVYAKPTVQGSALVLRYLARYVHRVAITDARILTVDASTVTFRYQDARARAWRTLTLAGEEFLRRFLQHVLPRGFHKVRSYGFWRPRAAPIRRRLQHQLAPGTRSVPPDSCTSFAGSPASATWCRPRGRHDPRRGHQTGRTDRATPLAHWRAWDASTGRARRRHIRSRVAQIVAPRWRSPVAAPVDVASTLPEHSAGASARGHANSIAPHRAVQFNRCFASASRRKTSNSLLDARWVTAGAERRPFVQDVMRIT